MELKIGAWNSGRGIFLLNLFRIIGIKMYSMLGLFVYIYIGVQKGYRNRSEIPSILFTHKTRSIFTHFALDIDVVR